MAQFSSLIKLGHKLNPVTITSARWFEGTISKARRTATQKDKKYIWEFYTFKGPRPSAEQAHKNFSLPKLTPAGSGSVYETKIKRKNEVVNPNIPVIKDNYWEATVECLKWTDWKMRRDVNRRLAAAEYFPTRHNLVNVIRNRMLPEEIRHEAHKDLYDFPTKAHPYTTNQRCAITSRPRGKLWEYRLSRIIWRHMADYNNLSGIMKARWGP